MASADQYWGPSPIYWKYKVVHYPFRIGFFFVATKNERFYVQDFFLLNFNVAMWNAIFMQKMAS